MTFSLPPLPTRRVLAALVVALLVASCGGVDSGGTGAPATALAAGPVTGLGSITINGVRFDDASAAIVDQDGRSLSADQLQVGMVCEVDASAIDSSSSSATALTVRTRNEIVGPVTAINRLGTVMTVLGDETLANSTFGLHGTIAAWNPALGTLRLHGLTVHVSAQVQYTGGTAADLAVGRAIDVVGTLNAAGTSIDAQSINFD